MTSRLAKIHTYKLHRLHKLFYYIFMYMRFIVISIVQFYKQYYNIIMIITILFSIQDFQTQFKCEFHLTPSPISVPAEKTAKNHIRCDTYQVNCVISQSIKDSRYLDLIY